MAYKKVEDFKKTPRLDPLRNGVGTQSEFLLMNSKQVESKNFPGKMNYVYTVKYNGKDLAELVAQFKEEFPDFEKDHVMSLWGSPILDRKLGEAEVGPDGVQTLIEYTGEVPSAKKGHNPTKGFDVYFDDGEGEAVVPETGTKKKTPF